MSDLIDELFAERYPYTPGREHMELFDSFPLSIRRALNQTGGDRSTIKQIHDIIKKHGPDDAIKIVEEHALKINFIHLKRDLDKMEAGDE